MGVTQKEEEQLCDTAAEHIPSNDEESVGKIWEHSDESDLTFSKHALVVAPSLPGVYENAPVSVKHQPQETIQYTDQRDDERSEGGRQRDKTITDYNQLWHQLSLYGCSPPTFSRRSTGSADQPWYVPLPQGRQVEVRELKADGLQGRCRCMRPVGIQVGPGRYALPYSAIDHLGRYAAEDCIVPGQVVVCTVPKSGTTWTLEMTWLLTHDCDFEGARCSLDNNRTEDLGSTLYFSPSAEFFVEYVPHALQRPSNWMGLLRMLHAYVKPLYRRETVVKTHLPLSMFRTDLLDTNKVIYVARNPKDALVSYYHHFTACRAVKYEGSLDDLAVDYMAGRLPGLPYFSHVLEAWRHRHHRNLLFLFYEEMKADLPATLRRVAKFLGKSLSEQQLHKLSEHLSFENMKENKYANTLVYQDAGIMHMPSFIREGRVGSWRQKISEPVSKQLDEWIERSTRGTGLKFKGL